MTPPVPVAVFAHNRPDLFRRVIECLRRDQAPLVHVFLDGPAKAEDVSAGESIRQVLAQMDWCQTKLTERKAHLGISKSIILGMAELFETHESAIVYEDHLATVPGTYAYLAQALHEYRDHAEVMSVTGWTHPRITPPDDKEQPYFDGRAEYRSWGTWRRAWQGMELAEPSSLLRQCHQKGIWSRKYGDDLPNLLHSREDGTFWVGCWLYWHMVHHGLCLRPPHSMVDYEVAGTAAQITSSDHGSWRNPPLQASPPLPTVWPKPEEHPACVKLWRKACKQQQSAGKTSGVFSRLKSTVTAAFSKPEPPPVVQTPMPRHEVIFTGPHASWAEAAALCDEGYASPQIVEQVRCAALRVKEGKAAYERDSITFDVLEHPWPVLSAIYRAARLKGRPVRVLDFGGALGSTYFQTRSMLGAEWVAQWCVVEQPAFVRAGREDFEDGTLRFAAEGHDCFEGQCADVLLLSGVLQFLDDPDAWLDHMISWGASHVLVDRTPVWLDDAKPDTIAVQTVSGVIYPVKYPMRFLSRPKFLAHFKPRYRLATQFDAMDTFQYLGSTVPCQGFLFDLNEGA